MNIFIDTNIFLSFYHFSNDDLEELKKLSLLLQQGKAKLFLPEQVIQEFRRNRDNKIADALKQLREQKLDLRFPQFCKEYDEFENLRQLQRSYSKLHTELIKKAVEDIQSENLKADKVIQDLFENGIAIPENKTINELARNRIAVGNPPGKNGSLGDALNWESLLESLPNEENLCFLTDDKDYASPIDTNIFNTFLLQEWKANKKSEILFYRSLSEFFKEHFPKISLASETEKDLEIQNLANSASFFQTHATISKLNKFSDFTVAQVNAIISAAVTNNQVYWIINDHDVNEFLMKVVTGKEAKLNPGNLNELFAIMDSDSQSEPEDDVPF